MAETPALALGFIPESPGTPLTIEDLHRVLTTVQRLVQFSAAEALGRDELTPAQRRDWQLVILDAHHSDLWLVLGTLARSVVESAAKNLADLAIHPLIDRLKRLLGQPEATSPIDAATLRGLVRLTESASRGGMRIQLESGSVKFSATPADHARLTQITIGYFGEVIELHGMVSEISFKRNELTLDLAARGLSIPCHFGPTQALAIRDLVRAGYPVMLRGRGFWGGEQISASRPDYIQIDALLDDGGRPLLLESPTNIME